MTDKRGDNGSSEKISLWYAAAESELSDLKQELMYSKSVAFVMYEVR